MGNLLMMINNGARRLGRREASDKGFTMVELMIALGIFSLFLTVVLSSIISITKASTKTQVTAQSASTELGVFQRLDHQIRYSDGINWPGVGSPSGDMYIEFHTPASSTKVGIALCTQWRYDLLSRSLQSRSWNDVVGAVPPPTWETDLTNMPNDGGAAYPFMLKQATNSGSTMQQLTLTLDTGNTAVKGSAITSTFVARNSSLSSPSNSDDFVPGTSDFPICTAGSRQ